MSRRRKTGRRGKTRRGVVGGGVGGAAKTQKKGVKDSKTRRGLVWSRVVPA